MILLDSQQVTLAIDPRNKKGNKASLDGVPQWATSDANVASVTPSADGLSCLVKAGATGVAQVSVTADADLGSGVRPLSGTLDIDVRAGEAITLAVTGGAPEEQP